VTLPRGWWAVVALVVACWLFLIIVTWAGQRALIYLPSGQVGRPAATGLRGAEEVTLPTEDGLRLRAWYVPPERPTGAAVLVLPGNAGNRSYRAPLAAALAERGFAVLLVDYRGYGGNPGRPSEQGLHLDARAARAYLDARADIQPARIAYYGESLGSSVAAGLALDVQPAALVLRSPFPSLVDVGRLHYPYLPVGALLRDRFTAAGRIDALGTPVLVIAGGADHIVPPEMSRRVAEAGDPPARFLVVPAAGHNDPALLVGDQVVGEITAFLREHVR
jgi:fermentation-respiration switch protein FrsA (DUF1100 family)